MPAHHAEEEATISIPSIAIVAVIGFLIYRYFWSSSASSTNRTNNGLRFTSAQVDSVAQMFPQLSRRDIMWDLQRNRGSVQATTERVLTGRGLDPAPPSFQPVIPNSTSTIASRATTNSIFTGAKPKPAEPDLITRYNLQSRISSSDKGKDKEEQATADSMSTATKDARQKMLQKRRDEMILQARRKMLEKDAARATAGDIAGQ